ncbi:diaminobutyrate--2-oxoglutarate transaminase [Solirubrobacter soli]|uniref:diaminobutyrate--2-oxoglutarate transaminase n=1 Tax=Solirubrobacter soli TaxID=363832 RepID=UPI0004048B02|nr:diaminobutyrate--2-oxoglutarate transaminase [Solirubrobacter soli]
MKTFERLESEVRSYSRHFPRVFAAARGSRLIDENGRSYVDFLAGAGVLNYGHNEPRLKRQLIEYLAEDGITHGLDMATAAKRDFLETFEAVILRPRGLEYKVQFPGPGGANAVEAALKLARKVTGRRRVVAFTSGFHGMSLGALAVSGNRRARAAAGVDLPDATIMPFDGYLGAGVDTLDVLARSLADDHSGLDTPAAFIVETVQGEGGVNVASTKWLRGLERLAREHGVLLIVDDIQAGCGRCGSFFSFEEAGITPDIVCLSKAISGLGLPMALTLLRPELDVWAPGEHNGTFRGNNLAFVTATAALEQYWRTSELQQQVRIKGDLVTERLWEIALLRPGIRAEVRGRGLLQGLHLGVPGLAREVAERAFAAGLVIETAGRDDAVLKIMPPLTISLDELTFGLDVIEAAIDAAGGYLREVA